MNLWLLQLIAGKPHGTVDRKTIPADEMEASADLKTIWNAEVCSWSIPLRWNFIAFMQSRVDRGGSIRD